jgi:Predicted permeases
MRTIKRLDFFLLKSFLPLFVMTFGICLFIFLMQFLWRVVDDLVGKGLEYHVLAELCFYAALKFVPDVLPLSILFAALMTFGNLGEQYELLAMKASGVLLIRIMQPLIILLVFVSIGGFFFQNNVLPVSQVKMFTLLQSVRYKSPELEIPEKTFFSEIGGRNIYVREKDKEKKLLIDIMITDYSQGFNRSQVILADSGRLQFTADKKFIIMSLYNGESFGNLDGSNNKAREAKDAVPYQRETFELMEVLMDHDSNFNKRSEEAFKDRFVGKNLANLRRSIDSMTLMLDSIKEKESRTFYEKSYRQTLVIDSRQETTQKEDSGFVSMGKVINFDSLYQVQDNEEKGSMLLFAKGKIDNIMLDYSLRSPEIKYNDKELRWHHTEMHRKFTLSFACLVFFFIGAPLGAIIRKGGLGTPAVLSVFLFVTYYIIDNTGYKFARDGVWIPWQGMWLSSTVFLPLGIFLTYKAVNDSVLLNAETYIDTFKRLIGKREYRKIEKKEVIIDIPDYEVIEGDIAQLMSDCKEYLVNNKNILNYITFWRNGGVDNKAGLIADKLEQIVEMLKNSDQNIVLNKVMDFPIIKTINFQMNPKLSITLAILFPIGGLIYLVAAYRRKLMIQDIRTTIKVSDDMINILNKNIK